jgi:hypothetical protein
MMLAATSSMLVFGCELKREAPSLFPIPSFLAIFLTEENSHIPCFQGNGPHNSLSLVLLLNY